MPLRNRVDPFGQISIDPHHGMLMGNRGILHDETGTLIRAHAHRAWISCDIHAPGEKRPLAAPGSYTVLFFLDEATALAAGHRPCSSCRRDAARHFAKLFFHTTGTVGGARQVDAILHQERGRTHGKSVNMSLPDGAMVGARGIAWLRWSGAWHLWSFAGYNPGEPPLDADLLTPPAIVSILAAGYRPTVHPTAG